MFNIFKSFNKRKKRTEERQFMYRSLFLQNSQGKEVLLDLMKEVKLFSNNYGGESLEYVEGKRYVLYFILNTIYNNVNSEMNINQLLEDFNHE